MVGYSAKVDTDTSARAIGRELLISPKHSLELCRQLRGMPIEKAKKYLNEVIAKKIPVPYLRFKNNISHRKGKGFGPGRYPVNTAKEILGVLEDAENNAEYKGLDPETMKIVHISANRGRVYKGSRPRAHGVSSPWNKRTTNIELILKEVEE